MTDGNILSEQPSEPSSISSILFTSTTPSISVPTPARSFRDDESEATVDPFDAAREIERRRAPHAPGGNLEATPRGKTKKPSYAAYVVFNGRQLGIFYNW